MPYHNVVETRDHDTDLSLKEIRFARTPIMSTYLVAFVVGEYDFIEDRTPNGITGRVYTPLGKIEQGRFALQVAMKALMYYTEYFHVEYPLPKLDVIALADLSFGAMENWGLITYRENCLLIDHQNSSAQAKQFVALIIGHEIAHMWFGNLVTMEWWTHLWLNEGFATFMEYLFVDHCFPEYNIWNRFMSVDLNRAMELDALKSSHPIEVPVDDPADIDEIFDAISYCKGASVIHMLHNWIGDKDFRKGMNIYLNKFKYKNAATGDLWESLEAGSGKPVGKVMNTWTSQMGYPVLKVQDKQEGSSRILELTQTRFLADGDSLSQEEGAHLWLIPVSISTESSQGEVHTTFVVDKPTTTIKVDNVGPEEWVKVNSGRVGVYRVHYSVDMLTRLRPAIKLQTLPSSDRLELSNDVFAMCSAGISSTVEYVQLVESFIDETDYAVWVDIAGNLSRLGTLLSHTNYEAAFESFNRRLFHKIGVNVGWDSKDNEGHSVSLLRSLVISCLGCNGHEETIQEAHKRLKDHISGKTPLSADIRSSVYRIAITTGDENVYESLLNLFHLVDLHEEKMRIAHALGSTCQEKLIERTLKFAISDEIRTQNTISVLISCGGSKLGRELLWQFVQKNWQTLHDKYEGGLLFSGLVKSSCDKFASEDKAKEIEAFFAAHPAPGAERAVQQAIERVCLNAAWLARDSNAIESWLQT
ncbi:puromycin-sensitive aminopeptidase-like [Corticium candelabrum]|uniref:puromycin-sensitive aminopeptidase-like n=1 Tax=Corticium candelabrum TaxID=121492 RepID=UPI002E2630C6|nr:puromycin-sensitive aminopeptidase-like [Corticium candelabrum]